MSQYHVDNLYKQGQHVTFQQREEVRASHIPHEEQESKALISAVATTSIIIGLLIGFVLCAFNTKHILPDTWLEVIARVGTAGIYLFLAFVIVRACRRAARRLKGTIK